MLVDLENATPNVVRLTNTYSHLLELSRERITTEMNLGPQNVHGIDLTGIVDRLEVVGSHLRVIDIKTHPGKRFLPGTLPTHASRRTLHAHTLQANIYTVMVEQLLTDDTLFAALYKPTDTEKNSAYITI
jgi:hypothetical protein